MGFIIGVLFQLLSVILFGVLFLSSFYYLIKDRAKAKRSFLVLGIIIFLSAAFNFQVLLETIKNGNILTDIYMLPMVGLVPFFAVAAIGGFLSTLVPESVTFLVFAACFMALPVLYVYIFKYIQGAPTITAPSNPDPNLTKTL
jgi:hypothetical protein